jgi:hypothetical protein
MGYFGSLPYIAANVRFGPLVVIPDYSAETSLGIRQKFAPPSPVLNQTKPDLSISVT